MMKTDGQHSLFFRILVIAGGVALFGSMLVEMLSIFSRLVGASLPGSVEIVQFMVTIAGTVALILATIANSHAAVRLITGRLKGKKALIVGSINNLLAMSFFLLLFIGSVWITADLWHAMEESEIWHIPFKPLRILVISGTLCVAGIFLLRSITGEQE